jgi:hypothetical protein
VAFRVVPDAPRIYGRQLDDAATDADTADKYIRKYTTFDWHEHGLISLVREAHDAFVGEVSTALVHLRELLDAARAQMTAVASYYEGIDAAAAGRVDASYPPATRAPLLDK